MGKYFAFFILLLTFCINVFSQTSKLTNKDVVDMVAAGLPEGVIISKIKVSESSFDTELPALKALQETKIPSAIISAMVEKAAEKPAEPKETTSTMESPEYGEFSEIKDAKKVYVSTEDVKARAIIIKALSDYPRLQVVGTIDEAEFMLGFIIGNKNTGASVIGSSITTNGSVIGELYAIRRGAVDSQNRRHQRIVWQTRKHQDYSSGISLSRHPAQNAINQFIKELKKLRGEK